MSSGSVKPDLQAKVGNQQLNQKIIHDRGIKECGFQVEDEVFVRNFRIKSGKPSCCCTPLFCLVSYAFVCVSLSLSLCVWFSVLTLH